jgi:putative SOS response-associated peptidase YedK
MCGRYRLSRFDLRALGLLYRGGIDKFEEFSETRIVPRFNIAPSQIVPIVTAGKSGNEVIAAKWGFVPFWTKGKPKLAPINAKSETVASSAMFRGAFKNNRCLVPADGFYEWKGAKPPKQPFFAHMKDDSVFAFAGPVQLVEARGWQAG